MKIVHWYNFFIENMSDKLLSKIISSEFSVSNSLGIKRLRELKNVSAEFGSWAEIDVLKEFVYCYVNNKFLAAIAVSGIVVEILLNNMLNDLMKLIADKKQDEVFREALLNYIRQDSKTGKLRMSGQKLQVFYKFPLDDKSKSILGDMKKILEIRNKYVHAKYITNESYKAEMEKDCKKIVKLLPQVVKDLSPPLRRGILATAVDEPNTFLRLY